MRRALWLLAPILLALCAGAAALIPTAYWATGLQHPARQPGAETTWEGAQLARLMLAVGAVSLVVFPALLQRLTPAAAPGERREIPSRELWTVSGLVVVALVVRATRLLESLWYDEIAAWVSFGAYGPGPIAGNFFEPSNHVAHTLATWLSVGALQGVAGFEIALRAPALLASLGTVVAVYALARRAAGPATATMAALLIAVWPVSVLEGAEARGYSMMMLAAALATWLILVQQERELAWRWCLYAAVCALGTWTHFVTAFVAIGHGVWLCWRARHGGERGLALRAALALALAAVLAVMLYAPALPDLLAHRGDYAASGGDEPGVFGPEGWHALLQLGGSWFAWAAAPGLALLAAGVWRIRRDVRLRDAAALSLAGLPLLVAVVLIAGSWMYARFALFALPGAALLAATGMEQLARRHRYAGAAALVVVIGVAIADLAVRPARQPLRDAAEWVRTRHRAGEDILVIGLAHQVMEVYLADLDPGHSLMHGADLEHRLPRTRPTWIVVLYPDHVSPERYTQLAESGFERVAHFDGWADWGQGDIDVYTRTR